MFLINSRFVYKNQPELPKMSIEDTKENKKRSDDDKGDKQQPVEPSLRRLDALEIKSERNDMLFNAQEWRENAFVEVTTERKVASNALADMFEEGAREKDFPTKSEMLG